MEDRETKNMTEFKYASKLIYRLLVRFETKNIDFAKIYVQFVNPINYAIVGGIGVLINYLTFILLVHRFPWWVTNGLAILVAWTWNWSMSVGPFGWLWGFKQRNNTKKHVRTRNVYK